MKYLVTGSPAGNLAAAVLLSLGVLASGAEAEKRYVKTKEGQRPKPIVAVDNVCAWPNLTMLGDGTIIAVGFNKPSHGRMVGDVDCWASTDGGLTWQKRGTPGPHEPHTCRANHAAGLAKNGDLIVICGGSSSAECFLDSWVCRSSNGGRTWSIDKEKLPVEGPDDGMMIPFGDIIEGNDGTLRVNVYAGGTGNEDRAYVYRSRDDGKSWGEPVPLDEKNARNETALFHLGEGKWLAAVRLDGLDLYQSNDDAKTWEPRGPITGEQQHPGHLMRLTDGRLLLSYGSRLGADKGVEVMTRAKLGASRYAYWTGKETVATPAVSNCPTGRSSLHTMHARLKTTIVTTWAW